MFLLNIADVSFALSDLSFAGTDTEENVVAGKRRSFRSSNQGGDQVMNRGWSMMFLIGCSFGK